MVKITVKLTGLGLILVAGIGLVGYPLSVDAADKNPDLVFTQQVINAPFSLTHTLLAVDVLPNIGKELLAFGVDDDKQRWLGIFARIPESMRYSLVDKILLPFSFHCFDISDEEEGTQQLYFQSSEHLLQFMPANKSAPFKVIADINPMTLKSRADYLSRGDFVKDLNGDNRADIMISGFTDITLLLTQEEGGFARQTLPIKPFINVYEKSVNYTESTLYLADMNLDGHKDIVKIGEGELESYFQTSQGGFNAIASYHPMRQALSGVDWWLKRDAFGNQLDQSSLVYRKVEEISDINNDGITDIVLRYTKSSGVLDRVNDYEIFLGESKEGELSFSIEPNSVIHAEGTLTGFEFIDIDNDDILEVMVSGFDIGLSQIIGALISGSIDQDVYLFKMDGNGRFTKKPNISKEVELSFSLTSGQSGQPVIKLADFNGDKYQDLLLSDGDTELKVYLGEPSSSLVGRRGEEIEVNLPKEGDMLSIADLNYDGKDDILIKYGRQDDVGLLSQFKVIISE
ncbi:VCBS repeat-containing protein [Shewanella sp. D64]|uniref:FG-GAP repeat domain-containing protein n=1 Tax=unclassified Shewanella TaxID=196818 RepID=UPI0022BA5B03|nr:MULTISPECIES: VCBS repeat-containing protein [unclassified Shewanella]MEC4725608.1 VCBS repeat-containing protein [Shewanella sp. D64]MEC4739660.1 VCBS repeat-containing protein [Shewanella sp. E94]WBJ94875.1 VCBS repeat-containing protein [Shewanella sp. MTB7]